VSKLLPLLVAGTGLSEPDIIRIVSNAPLRYKIYTIAKRRGGERIISQPARELKVLQRILTEEFLSKLPIHRSATAYRAGISIRHNALAHAANGPILKFDFTNFFPSISGRDWAIYCEREGLGLDTRDLWISTNSTSFFAQRKPYELGSFSWVVDGKEPAKVTRWEEWWAHYAQGALASMSQRRPAFMLPPEFNADYSHYEKFNAPGEKGDPGTSLKLLLKDLTFSSEVQYGLEFVDILTNAVRRALTGNLQREGWQNFHRLMIHGNDGPYISFVLFSEGGDIIHAAPYTQVVNEGFSKDGRLMLTKRNMRDALNAEGGRPMIAV
jgi:hypothetical protein